MNLNSHDNACVYSLQSSVFAAEFHASLRIEDKPGRHFYAHLTALSLPKSVLFNLSKSRDVCAAGSRHILFLRSLNVTNSIATKLVLAFTILDD